MDICIATGVLMRRLESLKTNTSQRILTQDQDLDSIECSNAYCKLRTDGNRLHFVQLMYNMGILYAYKDSRCCG